MKKFCLLLMCFFVVFGAFGCGPDDPGQEEGPPGQGSEGSAVFNPETDSPYKMEDMVKPDLIWNTEELFASSVATQEVSGLYLPTNMQAFLYDSLPYPAKGLEKTKTFAVIGVPETPMPEGGYPAIVLVHGGAGNVYWSWIRYWNDLGYVALAFDIYGNMLDQNLQKIPNPDGGPGEGQTGSVSDDPADVQNSWLWHGVGNIILANNILRGRTDVNPNQIGITGISWGGVLVSAAAGVDKRYAAFAPIYGCGYLYEDSKWSYGTFGGAEDSDGRKAWIAAYDPSSYLPYATKPMLFVSGVDDDCFSTVNRVRSAELVPGKVFYSQRSDLSHGYYWTQTGEVYAFMQHVLRGEDTVFQLSDVSAENGTATCRLENPEDAVSVQLVYTLSDDEDSHQWVFDTVSVEKSGQLQCRLPEGTTAFCFEVIGSDFRMSTEIVLI